MQILKNFASGYIKTILFAIEYKPKFQFPQELFIIPHFLHHAQVAGLILQSNTQDQLLGYLIDILRCTLLEPILPKNLKVIALWVFFGFQILLLMYLLIATFETQRVWIISLNKRVLLEKKIETVNQILHWYFTFYSVFTMMISAISLQSLSWVGYLTTIIQYLQGMILIYLLRNHRFAENNCFKRRFAYSQMINYSLQYGIVIIAYIAVDQTNLLYVTGFAYAVIQIIDQFYACPYRDPFREPSLKVSLVLLLSIILSYSFYQNSAATGLIFWLLLSAGLVSGFADSLSAVFHEFAMSNYNSKYNLEEKYIIIGVDQFYSHFARFQEKDETKLQYFQQLAKHKETCTRSKCITQKISLNKMNTNDKLQLNKLTLDVVSCIFKTCHSRTVMRRGLMVKPKFEQLQLQYINFLANFAARPLLAYVELRAYQINDNRSNSLYFRELTSKVSTELEFQILYLQDRMVQQQFRKEKYIQQEDKLSISMLWKSINFYQYITPKIIQVVEGKQKYWRLLLDGYKDLQPLQKQQIKLCNEMNELYNDIISTILIPEVFFDRTKDISRAMLFRDLEPENWNVNVLNLKIYSMLYAVILNDYDRAFQAEKQIDELIKEDRQKQTDMIDDSAIQKDDALIILVSLVRNKGQIVNKNLLTLVNFFELSSVQDVKSISGFLPPDLQALHDQLLNGFISNGYSKYTVQSIHSYFIQKQGFLRECYVRVSNLFQDPEDFILTGSVMRIQTSYDVVMFDSYGKIIGVSQPFYERYVFKMNENMTMERFIEQGHVFIFMPMLLINLKKFAQIGIEDFVDFAFTLEDLKELNAQFSMQFQGLKKIETKFLSSFNLSTVKSNLLSERSHPSSDSIQNCMKIQGYPIPLLNQEQMIAMLEFLITYFKKPLQCEPTKIKYNIKFECINTKKEVYPYFVLKMESLDEFERSQTINSSSSIVHQFKMALNLLKFGEQLSTLGTIYTGGQAKGDQSLRHTNSDMAVSEQLPMPNSEHDISAIEPKLDKPITIKYIGYNYDNPIISSQQSDNIDFDYLDKELRGEPIDLSQLAPRQNIQEDEIEILEAKSSLEVKIAKSNDTHNMKALNILDIFKKNKENIHQQGDHVQKDSSKASSQKTTSSKSPYLLIRNMYSRNNNNFSILSISLINMSIGLIITSMLFVKVFLVQQQYKNLQNNLNYVQDPETINNYFLKSTMYTYSIVEQALKLVSYSEETNRAIFQELNTLATGVESMVNQIYKDIIQFEKQVFTTGSQLLMVNNLMLFMDELDLTILLDSLAVNIIEVTQNLNNSTNTLSNEIVSNMLYFRLNLIEINKVATSYIDFLNNNLIYYESMIVNSVAYLISAEVVSISILVFIQIKLLMDINDYQKRILILTIKLSEEDALQCNRNLQAIKVILNDPQQILWKTTNYVPLIFDKKNNLAAKLINNELNWISSQHKKDSTKRRYQNSSLTSRVQNLSLPQMGNFLVLGFIWIIICAYLFGALIFSINMISQIKPAIDLNLQLIEFKLKFDSLVVFGEVTKVEDLMTASLKQNYNFTFELNHSQLDAQFLVLYSGFSEQLTEIYNQLSTSTALQQNQRSTLLFPFLNSLCLMNIKIPSCGSNVPTDDNSYGYISSGIVNMVQQFIVTLHTDLNVQLDQGSGQESDAIVKAFLNSQVHRTGFIQHFLYQGKVLETIATSMLAFNGEALASVLLTFQIYVYIVGFGILLIYVILTFVWIGRVQKKLFLQKLGLTLIPAEALIEQKTLQELKLIQNQE